MLLLRRTAKLGRTLLGWLCNLQTPQNFVLVGLLVLLVLFEVEGTPWLVRYAIAVNELSRATGQTVFTVPTVNPGFPWRSIAAMSRSVEFPATFSTP